MLVDSPESGEHLAERVGTDRDHEGQPDGGVHRVAPADPIPETEHVVGVDPERCDLGGVGRHGDEVCRHGVGAERGGEPCSRRPGVGERLLRGERLRRDHEQGCGRVKVADGSDQIAAVDIADEAAANPVVTKRSERFVRHDRTEVGATDPDVDDGLDRFPGGADPVAGPDSVRKRAHSAEYLVNGGHDILAVFPHLGPDRSPQSGMEHGAILGRVDPLAGDHRGEAVSETDFVCEGGEVVENRSRHAVLGQVDRQVGNRERHAIDSTRVVVEEPAKVEIVEGRGVALEGAPGIGERGIHGPMFAGSDAKQPDPADPAVSRFCSGGGVGYSEASSPNSSSTLTRAASTQPWISGSVAPSKVMTLSSSIRW